MLKLNAMDAMARNATKEGPRASSLVLNQIRVIICNSHPGIILGDADNVRHEAYNILQKYKVFG